MVERAQLITAEILATEKSYVAGLQICIHQYLIPLRNSMIIPPEKVGTIFSNIEQICEFNKELLVCRQKRSLWDNCSIGPTRCTDYKLGSKSNCGRYFCRIVGKFCVIGVLFVCVFGNDKQ